MFKGLTVHASDPEASEAFYRAVLPAVGAQLPTIAQAGQGAATSRLHIAFRARSRVEVDEFWRVGLAAGHPDDGAPGPRPQYAAGYYGSFLLDPDGNSVEAVHLDNDVPAGAIDHLWIRVKDLAASRRFYDSLADDTLFRASWENDDPPRVGFEGKSGSFSIVDDGAPTVNAHILFGAARDERMTDPDGNTIELVQTRP